MNTKTPETKLDIGIFVFKVAKMLLKTANITNQNNTKFSIAFIIFLLDYVCQKLAQIMPRREFNTLISVFVFNTV